ncbi:MAG: hypothetical protein K6G44_05145 [Lentisphaeria bacterium]|nr:hypothetical protein [Lentisphaeria bacterium]
MNTKFLFYKTTDHTDHTDFSLIASPQEPTKSEDFGRVYEVYKGESSNGYLRLGGCLPLRGAMAASQVSGLFKTQINVLYNAYGIGE